MLENIVNLFLSPRFVSFYWRTGSVGLVGLLSLISDGLADLGLPAWAIVFVGLILGEITKAINNSSQGKDLGFSRK